MILMIENLYSISNISYFLQKRITCRLGIEEFHLYCNGVLLNSDTPVTELVSDTLELTVPLLGGKSMTLLKL